MVSLIGEAWSPKTEPDSTAARNSDGDRLSESAISIDNGIIIANVPQLDPIEKAIKLLIRKSRGSMTILGTVSPAICAT